MAGYVPRISTATLQRKLEENPVVALIGPRQCGKSTLAKRIVEPLPVAVHLDLERPSDLRRLDDPEAYFDLHADGLICLDEVQRAPDLFSVIRVAVDEHARNGQFLVLGSASPELLRQSSESLAGRISYVELTPFLLQEVSGDDADTDWRELWLRGGFPRSYLARSTRQSRTWREDFIRTFLERDIPQLGSRVPSARLGRFWRFCAHEHGQVLNSSKLGSALGVSGHTIRSYLELLEQTFMVRVLPPCEANLKKRLVKSPKIYVRDSGVLHALLDIETHDDLFAHPVFGASWEGFVIEQVLARVPGWRPSFFRSRSGAEIDLVLERGRSRIAIECKASSAPEVQRGFWSALDDLEVDQAWVIAPVRDSFPLRRGVTVSSLAQFLELVDGLGSD
jgi:predicted AAA+ superfamily ATPase